MGHTTTRPTYAACPAAAAHRAQGVGFEGQRCGLRAQGVGFEGQRCRLRAQGVGFEGQRCGLRAQGVGLSGPSGVRASGLQGFWASGV